MKNRQEIVAENLAALTEGVEDLPTRAARVGRFLILDEMGFFGEETNFKLSLHEGPGTWQAAVRKRFSGVYGDVAGCHPADIEVAAEMLGVFDDVYDYDFREAA